MEPVPDNLAFDEASHLLRAAGVPTGAAEAHGIITGVLSAPHGDRVAWQKLIIGHDAERNLEIPEELSSLLGDMYRSVLSHLNGVEVTFTLLLPGDEHALAKQIEGLTDWCRGYLFGLHAGGLSHERALSDEVREIVQDITRISEAEMDITSAGQEEQRALVELVEYLRIGVQLIFEELHPSTVKH